MTPAEIVVELDIYNSANCENYTAGTNAVATKLQ